MIQHTPGPWKLLKHRIDSYPDKFDFTIYAGSKKICESNYSDNQNVYDVTLIEAAPEMLKALEGLAEYFRYMINDPQFHEYTEAIRIIQKAKGEL